MPDLVLKYNWPYSGGQVITYPWLIIGVKFDGFCKIVPTSQIQRYKVNRSF